jgi:putative toxin-antitoxin system antitoxin component (TIGR02293 family)
MSEKPAKHGNTLSKLLSGWREVREPASAEWHARILKGFPIRILETVKQHASLDDSEIARLLGTSEATLRRARAADTALDPQTSDRLFRFSKVFAVAIDVLESTESAMTWLRRTQPGLGGGTPLDHPNEIIF